jgi:hypothetical protein
MILGAYLRAKDRIFIVYSDGKIDGSFYGIAG